MGTMVSRLVGYLLSPIRYLFGTPAVEGTGQDLVPCKSGPTPFVFKRRGSQFFDEDGDLAHEFYEEVRVEKNDKKMVMQKRVKNLTPQGYVDLPHPRINKDFPVVMCEALWTTDR
ncbi:tumor suppressor candidate 2 [Lingula anatina]|uniref:Tumor suppressor candidate 2 n=1 Tax=Lingula anatina TaxID=7574 RepID=A0A1S3J3E1_LINAN|nr:tumor suppressor candidate 2 [Lingula anatina]|eukprot:XP_013404773.1 tumor suppressor candidate 2 [Lingula anatina]